MHKPTKETRAFVREKITAGATQERVATALGISVDTLDRRYREELDASAGVADCDVEACLGWKAANRDPAYNACTIFYAKTRLGYREVVPKDPDRVDVDALTDEQLAAIVGQRAKRARSAGSGGDSPQAARAA